MRVRPFFWILLATACVSVLLFAATVSIYKAIPMQAHVDLVSTAAPNATIVRLRLTDPEGTPIDQASVTPSASMLDMPMAPQQTSVQSLGQGIYLARISFSMRGSWKIDIVARADGFDSTQRSILVNFL